MVYTRTKRIWTSYNFYEREKLYKKSSYMTLSVMAFILIATFILHTIINMAEIVEIPKVYTEHEEVKEVYKKNDIKNSRKILADYSDFIIYSAPAYKKEEIKKEKIVEKKQPAKVVHKTQPSVIKTEKTVQNQVVGSERSSSNKLQNEIATKIVYQMERYKKYPKQAQRINAEGIAKVTFYVNASGVVSSVNLSDTSGYNILDNAALQAAEKIIGNKVVTDESYNSLLQVTVPVDFYLN